MINKDNFFSGIVGVLAACFLFLYFIQPVRTMISPLVKSYNDSHSLALTKNHNQVFGFGPYWNKNKFDSIDFNSLTTFAYFDLPITSDGYVDENSPGYQTLDTEKIKSVFRKAHAANTRVVLTITQMDNDSILSFLDSPEAQERMISRVVSMVQERGLDGINIDYEYLGNPGNEYRHAFTAFVSSLTERMHAAVPNSQVTVSVYASSVKEPKIYDIPQLAHNTEGIFMMAYDYATYGSDSAMPTAPLYGYKEKKYWYDVSTAVEDFLAVMPANKLILGVPLYGYNYAVDAPKVKAETLPWWAASAFAQTYSAGTREITPGAPGMSNVQTGWDDVGKVGWKSYFDTVTYTWRMLFLDDERSLGAKFDFAKSKNLAGIGLWALGNETGQKEIWTLISDKFGAKLADNTISDKAIN